MFWGVRLHLCVHPQVWVAYRFIVVILQSKFPLNLLHACTVFQQMINTCDALLENATLVFQHEKGI